MDFPPPAPHPVKATLQPYKRITLLPTAPHRALRLLRSRPAPTHRERSVSPPPEGLIAQPPAVLRRSLLPAPKPCVTHREPGGTVPSLLRPGCSHSAEGPPTTGRETRTVPRRTRERLRALQSPPGSGAAAPPSRAGGSRERRRPPRTPPPSELAVNPIFLKTTYIYIFLTRNTYRASPPRRSRPPVPARPAPSGPSCPARSGRAGAVWPPAF